MIRSVNTRTSEQFKSIKDNIGQVLSATYVFNGEKKFVEGVLEHFTPPVYMQIRRLGEDVSSTVLMLAPKSGIQSLVSFDGSLLYENHLIPDDFSVTDPRELDALKRKTFGERFDKYEDDERLVPKSSRASYLGLPLDFDSL